MKLARWRHWFAAPVLVQPVTALLGAALGFAGLSGLDPPMPDWQFYGLIVLAAVAIASAWLVAAQQEEKRDEATSKLTDQKSARKKELAELADTLLEANDLRRREIATDEELEAWRGDFHALIQKMYGKIDAIFRVAPRKRICCQY